MLVVDRSENSFECSFVLSLGRHDCSVFPNTTGPRVDNGHCNVGKEEETGPYSQPLDCSRMQDAAWSCASRSIDDEILSSTIFPDRRQLRRKQQRLLLPPLTAALVSLDSFFDRGFLWPVLFLAFSLYQRALRPPISLSHALSLSRARALPALRVVADFPSRTL